MERWQGHYGPSRWCRDLGAWRLIGIDTALLGSGLPEEEQQNQFLERSLGMIFTASGTTAIWQTTGVLTQASKH